MLLLSYIQKIVAGSILPWRLRYLISITVLQKLISSDRVLEGYLGNYRILLDLRDDIQRGIYLGFYEPIETRFIKQILKPGDIFFDVGANVGYYSLLSSQIVGNTGRVYAFEPIEENMAVLKQAIKINNIKNIVANKVAVGTHSGTLTLYSDSYDKLGNSGWASIYPSQTRTKSINVPQISLDEYVRSQAIERVRLVKIDVEGAEINVLRGMQNLLSQLDAPDLLCEIFPQHAGEILDYLTTFGYIFYPPPFLRVIEPNSEITRIINLFCSKKPLKIKPLNRIFGREYHS